MNQLCDLHAHSVYSDGTSTPAELITLAKQAGLCAIALTDHNTVSGIPAFLSAAENSGVMPVPGIEVSTDYMGDELHIVGLFKSLDHLAEVEAYGIRWAESSGNNKPLNEMFTNLYPKDDGTTGDGPHDGGDPMNPEG